MKHTILKSVAAAGVLALGVAACGSSGGGGGGGGGGKAATGEPLVIESTPLSPMTATFNPFSSTSTGFLTNAVAFYNEPLYVWNNMRPTQPPIPMLAAGQPTWSNGGKTLTVPLKSGVKWSDGKPFGASDVAFTFNMIKKHPSLYTSGAPVVDSASASGNSAVLNFSKPQYANLQLIGQVYIVPGHIWSTVGNPTTYADPHPVGTGPFVLDKFSPQGFTLKLNPNFRAKNSVRVPAINFPSYNTNANLVAPVSSGKIDWAGNFIPNIKGVFLSKDRQNKTWLNQPPFFASNNVVTIFLNTTKAPLNDAAVRKAISFGINRQQLSSQAEQGYEPPVTSSSGLLLPVDNSFLDPSLANDLPATGDPGKVTSILKADGWAKTGGKWTKNGQKLSFSITDPVPYSDYYQMCQLIAHQLNAQGFDVTVKGNGNPTAWAGDVTNGTFDATIHWSNQGASPYVFYQGWLDSSATAPVGKPAAGDFGRWKDSATQAALAQYAGSGDPATQKAAITKLEHIMSSKVPVVPLLNGGAWAEVSTRNYTGWPSATNPYMAPVPNTPYDEYTVLHLKPVS